jgi:AcrR family transcriptional regulator
MTARPKRVRGWKKESRVVAERRSELIQAAITSIAEVGYDAVTVVSICDAAGFSRGLIGHYFKGKDDLLLEAAKYITQSIGDITRDAVEGAGPDPLDRLHAAVTASFAPPAFTPERAAVWVSFAARARWSAPLTQIYREVWRSYRTSLSRLIDRAADRHGVEVDAAQAALTISQLIEGLWMGYAADPTAISREKAEAACHAYIDGLFKVQSASGRRASRTEPASARSS